jgi:hypothetical protein
MRGHTHHRPPARAAQRWRARERPLAIAFSFSRFLSQLKTTHYVCIPNGESYDDMAMKVADRMFSIIQAQPDAADKRADVMVVTALTMIYPCENKEEKQ